MSGHTPGPWKWWTSNSMKRLMRDDYDQPPQSVIYPYTCRDGVADCSVSEDDMNLISAAPELLEAAREAEAFITIARASLAADRREAIESVLPNLRAAIAKAEGAK